MEDNGLKLFSLKAENVMRLKLVDVEFKDGVMVIKGKNGQGKSSLLYSLAFALGGKSLIPDKPIREGEVVQ